MLSKKQMWQARQKFLAIVRDLTKSTVFSGLIDSVDADIQHYRSNAIPSWTREVERCRYMAEQCPHLAVSYLTSASHAELRIQEYHRSIANLLERRKKLTTFLPRLADWLVNCGLHPFFYNGQVSYCPKNRNRHKWTHRQTMKLERFILRHAGEFGCEIEPYLFEEICRNMVVLSRKLTIRYLSGEEIVHAYTIAVGGHSCMTGRDDFPRLSLYKENTDSICLAVVCYEDQKDAPLEDIADMSVRCLVWQTNKGPYIDRRYFSGGLNHVASEINTLIRETVEKDFGPIAGMYEGEQKEQGRWETMWTVCKRPSNADKVSLPYLDSMYRIHEDHNNGNIVFVHKSASFTQTFQNYLAANLILVS